MAAARVGVLATVRADGSPHLVPVVFATVESGLVSAVDRKPKTTARLQRLANIRHNPRVSLLAHEYSEEWSELWWVRADGTAEVIEAGPRYATAMAALVSKYPQYRDGAPTGPVILVAVDRFTSWTAGGG